MNFFPLPRNLMPHALEFGPDLLQVHCHEPDGGMWLKTFEVVRRAAFTICQALTKFARWIRGRAGLA